MFGGSLTDDCNPTGGVHTGDVGTRRKPGSRTQLHFPADDCNPTGDVRWGGVGILRKLGRWRQRLAPADDCTPTAGVHLEGVGTHRNRCYRRRLPVRTVGCTPTGGVHRGVVGIHHWGCQLKNDARLSVTVSIVLFVVLKCAHLMLKVSQRLFWPVEMIHNCVHGYPTEGAT